MVLDIVICPKIKNGIAESDVSIYKGKSIPFRLHANPQIPETIPNDTFINVEHLGKRLAISFININNK